MGAAITPRTMDHGSYFEPARTSGSGLEELLLLKHDAYTYTGMNEPERGPLSNRLNSQVSWEPCYPLAALSFFFCGFSGFTPNHSFV